MEKVIRANGLTKYFGDFKAVDEITFSVDKGEVVGYLGPNGSGKTTTFRMLLGLLRPTSGSAQVLGYDAVQETEQVRPRVGYMSQKFALYNELSVRENLSFYAGIYGVHDRERLEEVIGLMGLGNLEKERAGALSTGWRQRLALGIAIVHNPQLLFLDEPTSGVDPVARRNFWDLIYLMVDHGVTALVTTHYMDEAEYCQRVGIMSLGKLLAMDTPSRLKRSIFQGKMWEVYTPELLSSLNALEKSRIVRSVRLSVDNLRVSTNQDINEIDLHMVLSSAAVVVDRIEAVEPTLEDVFLLLSGYGVENAS